LRQDWDRTCLDSDPLLFPHRYERPEDQEVAAFIASSFAFGRVASIKNSVEKVLAMLGANPAEFLRNRAPAWDGVAEGKANVHRWVFREDLEALFHALSVTLSSEGSLEALFDAGDDGKGDTVEALDRFFQTLRQRLPVPGSATASSSSRGLKFLLPRPAQGGASKRAHLFLRWVVRQDGFDLGIWRRAKVTPARLLLPMDTHVHRICGYLGLTTRKTADLAAVREATAALRGFRPEDPTAYDWAISRMGILAECVTELTRSHCERCRLEPVCQMSLVRGDRPPPAPPW
jgi:uncharacterized protein (TIGR02757 family)